MKKDIMRATLTVATTIIALLTLIVTFAVLVHNSITRDTRSSVYTYSMLILAIVMTVMIVIQFYVWKQERKEEDLAEQ